MDPQIDLRPGDHYILPESLRPALAGNFGTVLQTAEVEDHLRDASFVAAVGDIVSKTVHDLGIRPRFFVCDYKTQRHPDDPELKRVLGAWGDRELRVPNPPATITREAWDAVRDAVAAEGLTRIVVDGEEDLLGIPVFLEVPEGAVVLYGAPGRGLVAVTVDAAFKQTVAELVGRMEQQ